MAGTSNKSLGSPRVRSAPEYGSYPPTTIPTLRCSLSLFFRRFSTLWLSFAVLGVLSIGRPRDSCSASPGGVLHRSSVPRWITSGRASPRPGLAFAVVVGLIVSSAAFSSELVSITRQAMALTMVAALVMVLFDRTMLKRPAQIVIGLLLVCHFIHSLHHLVSIGGHFALAWPVGLLWSKGWLGTPRAKIEKHRHDVHSRNIINGALVARGARRRVRMESWHHAK